jgi:hypothetical protein
MVVRFEVDACLPYDEAPLRRPPTHYYRQAHELAKKAAKKSSGSPSGLPGVTVIEGNWAEVPQTHILEIKTRSKVHVDWPTIYPQLYLSQTPHIHLAFHTRGQFTHFLEYTLDDEELQEIDEKAQEDFKKLRKLLGYIKLLVLNHRTTRLSLVCVGKTLSVHRIPSLLSNITSIL